MDNRGLTLVEMMVAVAISVIVIGAIWQFMLVSTRTYQSQKAITDLQQEVQQTMNHIENVVIEADRAAIFETDTTGATFKIYSFNKISEFIWNKDSKTLTYKETPVEAGNPNPDLTETAILAKGVEAFSVDVSKAESDSIIKASITLEHKGRTYSITRNITLRNKIVVSGNQQNIYQGDQGIDNSIVITILNPVGTEGLDPGDSYVFQASVTGVDDATLVWTVLNNTSTATTIDVLTGKLTVAKNENLSENPQVNKLTVRASLASNTDIYRETTVTVNPVPPATIVVDHMPDTVIYGGKYAIVATPDPSNYSITWAVVSGPATMGTTQAGLPELQVLGNSTDKADTIQLAGRVMSQGTLIREVLYTVKVRHPEFTINAKNSSGSIPTSYDYGSTVTLSADWSRSSVSNANYTEDDTYYNSNNGYIAYPSNYNGGNISWEAWYYQSGTKKTLTVSNTGQVTLPTAADGAKVYVKGTATDVGNIVCEKTLTMSDTALKIEAYVDDKELTGTVPFGKDIILKPVLTGASGGSYTWKAEILNWYSNGNSLSLSLQNNGDNTKKFNLTYGEKYKGKTILVTLKENNTGRTAELRLVISSVKECTHDITDSSKWKGTYNYLFAGAGNTQNPFFIPLESTNYSNIKTQWHVVTKNDGSYQDTSKQVMDVDTITYNKTPIGVLCTPSATDESYIYDKVDYVIVDVDNGATGEHIAMYKLVPTKANYTHTQGGENIYYYLPYNEKTGSSVSSLNGVETNVTETFVNFYGENVTAGQFTGSSGYPQSKSYICNYKYVETTMQFPSMGGGIGGGMGGGIGGGIGGGMGYPTEKKYVLTVKHSGSDTTVFTVNYKQAWNGSWEVQ